MLLINISYKSRHKYAYVRITSSSGKTEPCCHGRHASLIQPIPHILHASTDSPEYVSLDGQDSFQLHKPYFVHG